MKKIIIAMTFLLVTSIAQAGSVTDAPHNVTNNIACSDCHSYSLWWQFSPSTGYDDPSHVVIVTSLCETCHFEGSDIPYVKGHHHPGGITIHRTELGNIDNACTDCHNPHKQDQLNWAGSSVDSSLYLVKGDIQYNSLSLDNGTTTFRFANILAGENSRWDDNVSSIDWADDPTLWAKKNGTDGDGLILAVPANDPGDTFRISSVDSLFDGNMTITVQGLMDLTLDDNATKLTQFGLIYGQLIRDSINNDSVQFFNPATTYSTGQGGLTYVDPDNTEGPPKGLCVTCHTRTNFWTKDNLCRDGNSTLIQCVEDDNVTAYTPDTHNTDIMCRNCHQHVSGFALGSDEWKHLEHYAAGLDCFDCHTENPPELADGKGLAQTTVCVNCHNNGVLLGTDSANKKFIYGTANKTDYKTAWRGSAPLYTGDPVYVFGCFGCHNGRPTYLNGKAFTILKAQGKCSDDPAVAPDGCKSCHTGKDPNYDKLCLNNPQVNDCITCHDGSQRDYQLPAVGMSSLGHGTLVSTKWIRRYDCWYCHYDTVDENYNLSAKHLNQAAKEKAYFVDGSLELKNARAEIKMHPNFHVAGLPADSAKYISDNVTSGSGICSNIYCHSDGTSSIADGEVRPYTWKEGGKACNSCHGHDPAVTTCDTSGCHSDGRTGEYWNSSPEKKWLTAMPMYENTGPNTEHANSHYPHLFTGLSCEYCHANTIIANTVEEVSCLSATNNCHVDNPNPVENMAEAPHVNAEYHVNGTKDVFFKDGTSAMYNRNANQSGNSKTCSNTVCHVGGEDPVWGGSLTTALVCRQCHGSSEDFDDFGKFNNKQARISLTQWATRGHGRPSEAGPYPISGNPAADFPDNGCWYCHDSKVLHQNEERPFRLIQHDQFNQRFEKECVYCHMIGEDNECLGCHNALNGESLAPQLATISSPPFSQNHTTYVDGLTSCLTMGCHPDDASRHNTGAAEFNDQDEKDDVRNAYLQMGVCLKCHDVEANDTNPGDGKCEACHVAPEDDPDKYSLGFDPGLPGTGKIVPTQAKASSFHFGYKHFNDYKASLTDIIYSDTVGDNSTSLSILVDSAATWTEDQFLGRQIKIFYNDDNVTRSIVRNSTSTITVSPPFTILPKENDIYKIIDVVWKGGKFCWDCHDPHGDDNIYMIQNEVATRTDGVVGRPITRAAVSFIRKQTGSDYAKINAPFNGICNVCHSPDPEVKQHYTSQGGDNHNSTRICTTCHEHRFTDSHASNQACNECHLNKPVPRHTAFGQARNCTKCHADQINDRMNIMMQFNEAKSHHVQTTDGKVTDRHCYACHWEATPEGIINTEHHEGYNNNTHSGTSGGPVNLVVWKAGRRPTAAEYDDCATDDGNVTAVNFMAKNIDIWTGGTNSTAIDRQRTEVGKVTVHCLGCHSDQNNNTQPFNLVDPDNGDCKTPRQYAWDRSSIASRYSDNATAPWGKYSGPNVAQKTLQKAFSAHGNAPNNAGGFDSVNGEDETLSNTRGGIYAIQCFDCHSSHGSKVTGVTSSYTTFDGTQNGANLKETQAGKGGYTMSYMATANPDKNSVNPFEAGAGQCFDCHDNASSNTYLSPTASTPWGYTEIFGASSPVRGYRDSGKFGGDEFGHADRGVTDRFGYKQATLMGGHLKASHRNPATSQIPFDDNGTIPYDGNTTTIEKYPINGLCTPCHDPHGVTRSLGADRQYAVPLLKGTWVSSPYKEDVAPELNDGYGNYNYYLNYRGDWSSSYLPPAQRPDGRGSGAWRTDRNTFNQGDLLYKANHPGQYNRVNEDAERFAGLCLRCHPKNSLTTDIDPGDNTTSTDNLTWKSKNRIHRSVKGWGWLDGQEPREHSYTCSKCHSAHVSGLPRLMKTNCLNYQHRGKQMAGGLVGDGNNYLGSFPFGWWAKGEFEPNSTSTCHGSDTANGPSGWPDNQQWNDVTPWGGQ